MMFLKTILAALLLGLMFWVCTACTPQQPELTSLTPAASATRSPTPTNTETLTPTPLPTATRTATITPTSTKTLTPTPSPTYAILRGEVLMLSNCRYGPGAPYLYKYALIEGSHLEIIGRNDLGTWILVRAIGGNNPCWVKASLMDIQGDVLSVEPTYIPLPQSPYYAPPARYSARRDGDKVTVFWSAIQLRAGDDSGQYPYLIEAWICRGGQLIFTPVGTYETAVEITDEAGCSEPSHARLFGVEKHGYTNWVEIPWPPPD
jgi:hypothetical protein